MNTEYSNNSTKDKPDSNTDNPKTKRRRRGRPDNGRSDEELKLVEEEINKGAPLAQIAKENPEIGHNVYGIKEKLIKSGRVTEEQIAENKRNAIRNGRTNIIYGRPTENRLKPNDNSASRKKTNATTVNVERAKSVVSRQKTISTQTGPKNSQTKRTKTEDSHTLESENIRRIKANYIIKYNQLLDKTPRVNMQETSESMSELLKEFYSENPDIEKMQRLVSTLSTEYIGNFYDKNHLTDIGIQEKVLTNFSLLTRNHSIKDPNQAYTLLVKLFPKAGKLSIINVIARNLSGQDRDDEVIDFYKQFMPDDARDNSYSTINMQIKSYTGLKIGKEFFAHLKSGDYKKTESDEDFLKNFEDQLKNDNIPLSQVLIPGPSSQKIHLNEIWYNRNLMELYPGYANLIGQ